MRGRVHARRTLKGLVADLRIKAFVLVHDEKKIINSFYKREALFLSPIEELYSHY